MSKKPTLGRPARDAKNPRTRRVQVMISPAELETLQGLRKEGETLSNVVYRLIRRRIKPL